MSAVHHFVTYPLQEAGLVFLGVAYFVRLVWLHRRFNADRDRQPKNGRPGTGPMRGALYSLGILSMPWHLESARRNPLLYFQFVLLHLGVAAAIILSLLLPYAPGWLRAAPLAWPLGVLIGAGLAAAMLRLHRRITNPAMRAMSTFDDYFSLSLLAAWLLLAALQICVRTESPVVHNGFFGLTGFFLFYVPFSKISHYLYYPLSRYLLGRTLGWRGVYPAPIARSTPRGHVH